MDRRQKNQLEQERDASLKKIIREIERLDNSYTKSVREKEELLRRVHSVFKGDTADFQRLSNRVDLNVSEFEKLLRKKRRFLEEEKKETNRDFERKLRAVR